jgi:hypothetical protein
MQCNYLTDNHKAIEAQKKDPMNTIYGTEETPIFTCHTGVSEYEPTAEETQTYCTMDFLHCPRLYTKLRKH